MNASLLYLSQEVTNQKPLRLMTQRGYILSNKMYLIYLIDSNKSQSKWLWKVKVRAHLCTFEQRKRCCFGRNPWAPGRACMCPFIPDPQTLHTGVHSLPGYKAEPVQDQGLWQHSPGWSAAKPWSTHLFWFGFVLFGVFRGFVLNFYGL